MSLTTIMTALKANHLISLSPHEPYTYASGMKSPIYTDLRLTLSYPDLRQQIAQALAALIKNNYPQVTIIGGVATAGIPHATLVANELNLPMSYVRPKPKNHGKGRQVEGRIRPTDQIVLIDDLITTGGSVLEAVKATKAAGGHVIGVSSIFSYDLPEAQTNFAKAQQPFAPLISYPELIQNELAQGQITPAEYHLLKAWHDDPWAWGK
ncbi:MAG: orotate phosphoribosyltransferase [Lactobacillus sp.]